MSYYNETQDKITEKKGKLKQLIMSKIDYLTKMMMMMAIKTTQFYNLHALKMIYIF